MVDYETFRAICSSQKLILVPCCRSSGEEWRVNIVTTMDFTLDSDFYSKEETRTVKHNDEIIFSREYKHKFDRNPPTCTTQSI